MEYHNSMNDKDVFLTVEEAENIFGEGFTKSEFYAWLHSISKFIEGVESLIETAKRAGYDIKEKDA